MQVIAATTQASSETTRSSGGLNRYLKSRGSSSETESSSGSDYGFATALRSLYSLPDMSSSRTVVTGTNPSRYNQGTTVQSSVAAYQKSSSSYQDERESVMQSASLLQSTRSGLSSMASYLTGSSTSPIQENAGISTLTSLVSNGIRQYSIMENGASSGFNLLTSGSGSVSSGISTISVGSIFKYL